MSEMLHDAEGTADADADADATTPNHRTITQILIRTLVTHILAIANYGHLGTLLHIPARHNAHIFRLVVFLFFPAIALSPVIIDALQVLLRFLQNPDETSPKALKFYLHAIIGVRAIERNDQDAVDANSSESRRLLELPDLDAAHLEHTSWTWRRVGRIAVVFVVMAQGAGTIALWARRLERAGLLSIDSRNFYLACGSVISSILALLLLILGHHWRYTPEIPGHLVLPRWPETRRLLVEVIIAGVLQEAAANFTGNTIPKYATTIWSIAPRTALEWVLYSVLSLMVGLFRKDIEAKLGVKLQPVGLLLLGIACIWIVVDAIGLVVVDIAGLVAFDPTYTGRYRHNEAWSDPLEQIIPVI